MTFVEKVFQDSVQYATEVGDRLKESVYDALRHLINGFFEHPANGLNRHDPDTLRLVHENALIVLCRLLFLLYAEDCDLLPCSTQPYASYSLYRLQREINQHLREGKTYPPMAHRFWGELTNLFALIDEGFPEGGIPAYNGGLFSPTRYPHVAHTPQVDTQRWEIGDHRLAEVIDLLAYERDRWNEPGTRDVDYATLAVQHLGSIYEGLLELQPRIADEPLVETTEDGKPAFKPVTQTVSLRPIRGQPPRTANAGEVYLVTNRGERKATGSYYTPKYIVENTVGPLADEAVQQAAALRPDVDKEIKSLERRRREWAKSAASDAAKHVADCDRFIEAQKRRVLEPYLSLKILDPAMGSGHFLVSAADWLSLAMATGPNLLPLAEMGDEDPQAFYKRLIVERCLYGVDLNPLAVELAKLSLWLHTVSKDRALSFLDHHLRCGNSLIGAHIEDNLSKAPPPPQGTKGTKGKRQVAASEQLALGFYETLTGTHLSHFLDTFCIPVIANQLPPEEYEFEFSYRELNDSLKLPSALLAPKSWILTDPKSLNALNKLLDKDRTVTLRSVVATISEGIVTGCNDVFVVDEATIANFGLERTFIKRRLAGEHVHRFECSWANDYVIYPYRNVNGQAVVMPENELAKESPNLWRYLRDSCIMRR